MIQQTLKQYFGYDHFREGQQEVISSVINGHSAAAIFPTGSGKSLCYQLAALHLPHLTLVVSPLLALIQDQLDFLASKNIAAASIDSSQNRDETSQVMDAVRRGDIKILMISVERLKNERFRNFITNIPVSLLVVDEAHCISEWGHNFRPDYLKLPHYQQAFNIPQSLLLTATATPKVVEDMRHKFGILSQDIVVTGFYRPNLHLTVNAAEQQQKRDRLLASLATPQKQPTIIYVTLQKTAEQLTQWLVSQGINANAYHAGMKSEQRDEVQQQFMLGQVDCIVATIAFGMGIDKSNIRQVIHYDLPKSIENYSQEIGRAGRDGLISHCLLLANRDNLNVLENFIYGDTPELSGIYTVLQEIKQHQENKHWEIVLNRLSSRANIRQLPLKTLLVCLEMEGVIQPLYAYFASYRFKLLIEEQHLINKFQGERQAFVKTIIESSQKAKTWHTVNFDTIYQRYGAERSRIITALEYFDEKQYISLESKQMTDVFQVVNPHFDLATLANQLYNHFKAKEQSEISRIDAMIALLESEVCISRQLALYFGDTHFANNNNACGHCSVCHGKATKLGYSQPLAPLSSFSFSSLCLPLIQQLEAPPSADFLTRFLCGLTNPLLSQLKARSLSGYASLEHYRYEEVKAWVTSHLDN